MTADPRRLLCDDCDLQRDYQCDYCGQKLCDTCADTNNVYFANCEICQRTICYTNDYKCVESYNLGDNCHKCDNCGN